MPYEIAYLPECWEDVESISRDDLRRIKNAIEKRLALAPDKLGRPLRGDLKGRWRMRIGDYRIIYSINANRVLILLVGNRRDIYGR
ncbi:MAG: type II toxin-antitoxin system RelE/ParE family toxin [Elusimicrobia bacterium]|nr:type II toxin-antitoxin system RelE/ParE family toxin [Elusimicrobiota bacterium]